jgi:hypothetical protein
MGDVGTLGTLGNLEASRGSAARDIAITGVGGQEAATEEGRRYNAIIKDLTNQRSDVRARLPGIREEVRQQMQNEEMQKASQRFQEGLAGKQFRLQKRGQKFQEGLANKQQGLAERAQGETERSNRAGEKLNWAGIRNERARIAQEVANAGTDAQKEQAQARGERFNAGVEILTNWFKPSKQEQGKKGKMGPKQQEAYNQRLTHGYTEMVQQVMASTGMGPVEARRVVLAASDRTSDWGKRWVRRAAQEIKDIRRKRAHDREVGSGSAQTPGPGGSGYRPT